MMLVFPTSPTTLLLSTSFLATAACWAGSVCSVWMMYWIGRPLMPPLAFTHLKYAAAMFGMSVKSVPGCLVAMAPSLIGAPVAFLPFPSPHTAVTADALPDPTLAGLLLAALASMAVAINAAGTQARRLPSEASYLLLPFWNLESSPSDSPVDWACRGAFRPRAGPGESFSIDGDYARHCSE